MKKAVDIEMQEGNINLTSSWETLKFHIDEKYQYVPKGILFSAFSNLIYYIIAFPILKLVTKIVYDLKIEGKENIKGLKGGAISVSNHVLILDCAMVGIAWGLRKVYYTTQEGSFKIPFVRKLIKLLRAIPIPTSIENRKRFIRAIDEILQKGNIVHFYPEATLWPYCREIRLFKNGAFDFAIKNKIPIVPMIYCFRKPKGIRKIFKSKLDVTLIILKPIKCKKDETVDSLSQRVYIQMRKSLNNSEII